MLFLHTGETLGLYDRHAELAGMLGERGETGAPGVKGELGNISSMNFKLPENA